MRCTGRTLQAIADELKYGSPSSAFKAIAKHIERLPAEDQEKARALSAGSYEQVMARLFAVGVKAEAANRLTTAVQAYEAAANVRAKHDALKGIQAPVTTKVDVQVTSAVAVINDAEERLRAILAARAPQIAIPAIVDAEVIES